MCFQTPKNQINDSIKNDELLWDQVKDHDQLWFEGKLNGTGMKKNTENNIWKISSHKKAMSADQLSRKSPRNSVLDLSNRKSKASKMTDEVFKG